MVGERDGATSSHIHRCFNACQGFKRKLRMSIPVRASSQHQSETPVPGRNVPQAIIFFSKHQTLATTGNPRSALRETKHGHERGFSRPTNTAPKIGTNGAAVLKGFPQETGKGTQGTTALALLFACHALQLPQQLGVLLVPGNALMACPEPSLLYLGERR